MAEEEIQPKETGIPVATADAGDQTGRSVEMRTVEAAHQFALRDATASQITSDQNDYAAQDTAFLRLSSDAARTVTGISGGYWGRVLFVLNAGSYAITLKHQSASSAASNRIVTADGSDLALDGGESATLHYDATESRWRVVGTTHPRRQPTNAILYDQIANSGRGIAFDWANGMCYVCYGTAVGGAISIYRYRMVGTALATYGISGNQEFVSTSDYSSLGDAAILGGYLYTWCRNDAAAAYVMLRVSLTDGSTNELTVSGTGPGDVVSHTKTDGTFLYVLDDTSTTVRKYSLSGTTMTYVSQITLDDTAVRFCTDGTNIWYMTTESGGASTLDDAVIKADMAGATVDSWKINETEDDPPKGMDLAGGYVFAFLYTRVQYGETAQMPAIIPLCET